MLCVFALYCVCVCVSGPWNVRRHPLITLFFVSSRYMHSEIIYSFTMSAGFSGPTLPRQEAGAVPITTCHDNTWQMINRNPSLVTCHPPHVIRHPPSVIRHPSFVGSCCIHVGGWRQIVRANLVGINCRR